MSFGRKIYDGDFTGRDTGVAERGSAVNNKSKVNKHASPKRTKKTSLFLTSSEKPFENDPEKDRYLITYADVITLMLGLFIILYAVSNIDTQKYEKIKSAFENSFTGGKIVGIKKTSGELIVTPVDNLRNHLKQLITDNGYSKVIKLEENEHGIIIHILDEILFQSGSADLNTNSLVILDKIASILNQIPNDIRIEGHTDNVPIHTASFPSNWHLSVMRALNTAYYLINNENLKAQRVSIVGNSEYKPIASNKTVSGRAQNRRVDIVIVREEK
jgi:chemotaxis protein MotB